MAGSSCTMTQEALSHVLHKLAKFLDWDNIFMFVFLVFIMIRKWNSKDDIKNNSSEQLSKMIEDAQNELERRRCEPGLLSSITRRFNYGGTGRTGRTDEENQL